MRILLVQPHMDDETFSCGGIIEKHIDDVFGICSFCLGRRGENNDSRIKTFNSILKRYDIEDLSFCNSYDLELHNEDFNKMTNLLHEVIVTFEPDIVITSHDKDIHQEHRLVSNMTRIAARNVNTLLEVYNPCSSYTSPDYFDVTVSINRDKKQELCNLYSTENVPEVPNVERFKTIWRKQLF